MCGAAILDFEVGVDEAHLTFWVRNHSYGGVAVESSNWELFDFLVQMEYAVTQLLLEHTAKRGGS